MISRAFVTLVGAGPGDPELLTLRGLRALQEAEVVLFDYLANPAFLQHCPQAETIYVGKKGYSEYIKQPQINELMVQKAQEGGGRRVVRLKGGDPFVFGRGGEELAACAEAGIPFEVVSGVTSAIAAPAYAGIPLTYRGLARSFAVLTGSTQEGRAHFESLASVDTLVLLMSVTHLREITGDLIAAGRSPDLPAAVIEWGSLPRQRVAVGTLSSIAAEVEAQGLQAPAVTVVGEVVGLREKLDWFVPPAEPLAGKVVAVTRTRDHASGLSALLRRQGASVIEVPLIRFAPPSDPSGVQARLRDLNGTGWLALTSGQAVTALFERLQSAGLDARHLSGVKIAAVGPSTAQSLLAHGLRADFVPSKAGARYLAAELPHTAGKVLHPTSQQAEDELQAGLASRGVGYERLEVYRTESADLSPLQRQQLASADVVTLASGSAARHLATLAGTALRVAVMGPQTADAARRAGFEQITLAPEATLEGLAQAAAWAVNPSNRLTV